MLAVKEKNRFKDWWLGELKEATPSKVVVGHGAPVLDASIAQQMPDMASAAL